MRDRRLLAALALSLLIHLAAVLSPGWGVPLADDEADSLSVTLNAELALPRPKTVAAAARAVPPRAPKPRRAPVREAAPAPVVTEASGPAVEERGPTAEPDDAFAEAPVAPVAPLPSAAAPPQASAREASTEISLPRQGRIRYRVTRGEGEQGMLIGESLLTWSHDGSAYALKGVTETTGLVALFRPVKVVQASVGAIGADGLVPREFRVERNGQVAEGARLDWEAMRVALSDGGRLQREAPLAAGTQDLLSQVFQIGLTQTDARTEMMIATGKNYTRYVFEAVGEERLATRFGALRTWHLKTPAVIGEQTTELWLALDQRNLPVRIRHIDRKGDIFDQTAVEIEIDGTKLAERSE